MVRRSNAISRETCQIQNVDGGPSTDNSEERCHNVPGPIDACRHHQGNETYDTRSNGGSG